MTGSHRLDARVTKRSLTLVLLTAVVGISINSTLAEGDKPSHASKSPAKAEVAKGSQARKSDGKIGAQRPAGEAALLSGRPRVVELGAPWCVPCKKLAPIFEKVKSIYGKQADFVSLNMDDPAGKAFADKHKLDTVPDIIIFDPTGRITYRTDRVIDEATLTKEVQKVVGK